MKNKGAFAGCLSGAMLKNDFLEVIRSVGFEEVNIVDEKHFPIKYLCDVPLLKENIGSLRSSLIDSEGFEQMIASITVLGQKSQQFQ